MLHSVVEAVSGIVYPAVNEVTPVPEVYVSPVAVFENSPRKYAGVRAVVEAAAAFQLALLAVTVLYVLFQFVVEAVSGMLYPAATPSVFPVQARLSVVEILVLGVL